MTLLKLKKKKYGYFGNLRRTSRAKQQKYHIHIKVLEQARHQIIKMNGVILILQ